nr:MAG TPA: hypothetical protein [Caudoviricetes sp.]
MNKWCTYGTRSETFTLQQVEATARALEDADLYEAATEWNECARQMRAAEIVNDTIGVGAEIVLPNGISIYLTREGNK